MTWPAQSYPTSPPPGWPPATAPRRRGQGALWASITVAALGGVAALLALLGAGQEVVRIEEVFGEGSDAQTYLTSETGWTGSFTAASTSPDEYAVVRVGLLVVVGVVVLLAGAGVSFLPRCRAAGLALAGPGAGALVAAAVVPALRVSAVVANDPGGDGETARSFQVDLGTGGYLLIVAAALAAVAAVVGVVGAGLAGRAPRAAARPVDQAPHQGQPDSAHRGHEGGWGGHPGAHQGPQQGWAPATGEGTGPRPY